MSPATRRKDPAPTGKELPAIVIRKNGNVTGRAGKVRRILDFGFRIVDVKIVLIN